ncbi:MAG: hypothetical protein CM15mP59_0410 [Flavobacteriaceae bacterium]|nr:MAG: hypothetical protein CM15mP59_0410 [Flavobacteriaceae bacterium]
MSSPLYLLTESNIKIHFQKLVLKSIAFEISQSSFTLALPLYPDIFALGAGLPKLTTSHCCEPCYIIGVQFVKSPLEKSSSKTDAYKLHSSLSCLHHLSSLTSKQGCLHHRFCLTIPRIVPVPDGSKFCLKFA